MENGMNTTVAVAEIEETLEEHTARMKRIADEVKADIKPESFWIRPTKEKDWDQKKFVSGPATPPSEATRIKRREERNRKKKK